VETAQSSSANRRLQNIWERLTGSGRRSREFFLPLRMERKREFTLVECATHHGSYRPANFVRVKVYAIALPGNLQHRRTEQADRSEVPPSTSGCSQNLGSRFWFAGQAA
jgi:hypothetical protein